MKTNNSVGLPSSLRGIASKNKRVIIVFITMIISLLTISLLQFNKDRSTEVPVYATGNEVTVEEKSKDFLETLIDNKIKELKEEGYNNITYMKKEDLKLNMLSDKNIEEYVLSDYEFYAEYTIVEVDKKEYIFKSSTEANAFIKKLQKYENKTYKTNNKIKQIGKETLQDTIDEIILSKKIVAEKVAVAAKKAKAQKEAEAKAKAKKAAAAKKTNKNSSKNTKKKTTTTTKKVETQTEVKQESDQKASATGIAIVNYAKQFNGKRYVLGGQWNGELPYKPTDCSGFVRGVYKHFGYNLPRGARSQSKVGKPVSWNNLQPGDLVFYSGNGGKSVTHVAMYIGNGKIIHAQTPQHGIGITTANIMVKMGARRII